MKTTITTIFAALLICLTNFVFAQLTIKSTMDGGLWSDPATWTGGSLPTANDEVELQGPVYLDQNATCDGLTVQTGGELRNSGGPQILNITSNVVNNGLIDDISFILTLNISGNIENHGAWQNSVTNMVGTLPQEIMTYATFEGTQLNNVKPSGNISSSIPLRMEATTFDLNNGIFYFTTGLDTLYFNNGVFLNGSIICQNAPGKLYCMTNAVHEFENISITCSEVRFDGHTTFSDYFEIFGDMVVLGTLNNTQSSGQSLTVNGNVINMGTIIDLTYGWSLYITGNIVQNGSWTVFNTYLSGDDDQNLYFNNPFEGENLHKNNPGGIAIAQTSMRFMGTMVDFNLDTLLFSNPGDSLYLDGSNKYMRETVITGPLAKAFGPLKIVGNSNAFFEDVEIIAETIELSGTFRFKTPVIFNGDLVVNGFLENYNNIQEATILGNITNNGTIQDPTNNCRLYISGNIYQNGNWLNNQTYLNGTADQSISIINNQEMNGFVYFDALNAGSPYQWYYEGGILNSADFTGETANQLTWQVPVGSAWFGEFYCETGAGPSRTITVEGGFLADIKIYLEGPYNGTDMNTSLNIAAIIPLNQPYDLSPWNYPGTENVASFPSDIVDWVLADFRETVGGPETATAATSIFRKALLLRNDGYLVNLDGSREITVGVPDITNNLYVVIYHRNHLPVLSNNAISISNDVYTYDFTTAASQAYGSVQNDLGGGVYGLISGDANADGTISELDLDLAWESQAGETGYLGGDLNFDTTVDNKDKNDIWWWNLGKNIIVPK